MIDFDEIKQILEIMRAHELAEFEYERDGLRIRLKKGSSANPPAAQPVPAYNPPAPIATPGAPAVERGEADALQLAVVKSPVVGTFYRSADPGAPPFMQIGDTVTKGQVLCIIEAMKLMNEITSEYDGEVVNIFVENGQPVQYGEQLFAIKAK